MAEEKKYKLRIQSSRYATAIDYEKELNEQQYEVVTSGIGPKLVIAGAGSGKTRVVTYRVAWLLEHGNKPQDILLLTFTNKAAREMMHRVALLTGINIHHMWGGTFHHIGNMILRRHAQLINYDNNYTILDKEDKKDLISSCIEELKLNIEKQRFPSAEILSDIFSLSSNTDNNITTLLELRYPQFSYLTEEIQKIYAHYEMKKKECNSLDYDDLLLLWKKLLLEHSTIKKLYSNLFLHILVDEYQDTNLLQAEIIDLLSSETRNPMVVGDDSQSIYSFRGANYENIIEFPKRYPDCKIYKLEINYRSIPEILNLANEIIKNNINQFHKELVAVRHKGELPNLVITKDASQQAHFVAQRILELYNDGISLNDIAVLYRAHYHSLELQMELTRFKIPFLISSGLRFNEQRHIKDVISFLKVIENNYDELAWKRILKLQNGIGNQIAEKIWQEIKNSNNVWANFDTIDKKIPAKAKDSWKIFKQLLNQLNEESIKDKPSLMIDLILKSHYKDYLTYKFPDFVSRIEDIEQLRNYASQYNNTHEFLSELALLSNVESEDILFGSEENERVKLSTVHQAKGLEWKVVFIIWLTDGKFPSARSLRDLNGEEEERRLFYVAVTRCKDDLYLVYPTISYAYSNKLVFEHPSRFLSEIHPNYYQNLQIELLYENPENNSNNNY